MKVIIALVMTVALVAASTTLAESGSYKFTINFSKNSSNSSNSDVVLGLTVGSTTQPMTNSMASSGVCLNVGTSNYQLTTASSALKGFAIQWTCSATCTSLGAVYTTAPALYGAATFSQGITHTADSPAMTATAGLSTASSNNSTAKTVSFTITGLTPTQLSSTVYMPNQTETWYVRCFGKFNAAALTYTSAISDLATAVGNGKNLSLKGNGYQVATILAVAGSLVASLA
mmetsp:Transcript_27667/g.27526  ORF Transcript_27667/g.27526 Transcript_27667/m.27526 type:complete len:230 (-) Transcript_27667:51-740(-)